MSVDQLSLLRPPHVRYNERVNHILDQFIKDKVIDEAVIKQLEKYVQLFQLYNKHTNLSAIREEHAIWEKHIIDSLELLRFENIAGKLIDVGTGGGLPGIPLAIARPELQVTLLDSVGKKAKACQYFIESLKLNNAQAIQARAESIGQQNDGHRRTYDIVTSRATAYLPTILAWCEQFVKPGGRIILYKTPSSGELADGAAAAEHLKLKPSHSHVYMLDGKERHLLIYAPVVAKQTKKR